MPSMAPGFIPLVFRTCLDVLRDIGVDLGPPDVLPPKLDCLLLSKVYCRLAGVFGFEDCEDHRLGNVEAFSVVENVVEFHCQIVGWVDIIRAVVVSAGVT